MELSRRRTERPKPSAAPSFLGYHRRRNTDTSSILLPLIRAQTQPETKSTSFACPQQTAVDPGNWRLPRRQRRLSIPLPPVANGIGELRNTDDQTQSLLFKLPQDLRILIYDIAVGDRILHIVRRRDKLGHRACRAKGRPDICDLAQCRGRKVEWGLQSDTGDGGLIQLLQTCRKVYTEAVPLLYSRNTLSFDSLETFLAFSCAILPCRFDSIRRLELNFQFSTATQYSESHPDNNMPRWERTWRVIATMTDLEEIKLRLDWPRGVLSKKELAAGREVRLLRPLLLVSGLKRFDVALPTLSGNKEGDLEGLPFSVTRYELGASERKGSDASMIADSELGM